MTTCCICHGNFVIDEVIHFSTQDFFRVLCLKESYAESSLHTLELSETTKLSVGKENPKCQRQERSSGEVCTTLLFPRRKSCRTIFHNSANLEQFYHRNFLFKQKFIVTRPEKKPVSVPRLVVSTHAAA